MTSLLTRKLELFGPLPDADMRLLEDSIRQPREVPAGVDLIQEGASPSDVFLILDGFACRYKILRDGTRQIVAYLVPGDFCDFQVFVLRQMDHSLGTLSRCTVVNISRERILEWTERPAIARALWFATMVDEATLREWLVNIGARSAEHRIAHLLCELLLRLGSMGMTNGDTFELPLTQREIGDTMGLSSVHVNRVLQKLRAEGLITLRNHALVILDAHRLKAVCGFDPNYLHLTDRNGVNGKRR